MRGEKISTLNEPCWKSSAKGAPFGPGSRPRASSSRSTVLRVSSIMAVLPSSLRARRIRWRCDVERGNTVCGSDDLEIERPVLAVEADARLARSVAFERRAGAARAVARAGVGQQGSDRPAVHTRCKVECAGSARECVHDLSERLLH